MVNFNKTLHLEECPLLVAAMKAAPGTIVETDDISNIKLLGLRSGAIVRLPNNNFFLSCLEDSWELNGILISVKEEEVTIKPINIFKAAYRLELLEPLVAEMLQTNLTEPKDIRKRGCMINDAITIENGVYNVISNLGKEDLLRSLFE